MGASLYYIPEWCMPDGVENPIKALAILEHYEHDDTKSWSFSRHSWLGQQSSWKKSSLSHSDLNAVPQRYKVFTSKTSLSVM